MEKQIISGLIEKGIIKEKKLKKDPGKIRWQYIITPRGIREKLKISHIYLKNRTQEFERIQNEIVKLKKEVFISASIKNTKDVKQRKVEKKTKSFYKGQVTIKILVTGSAVFIGFHVSQFLLNRGVVIVGLDNFNPYYDVKLKEDRNEILDLY